MDLKLSGLFDLILPFCNGSEDLFNKNIFNWLDLLSLLSQCSLLAERLKVTGNTWQKTRTMPQTNVKGNQLGGSMGQKREVDDSPCTLAKQVKQLADKRNCETCALAE